MDAEQRYFWQLLEKREPPVHGRYEPFMLTFYMGGPICLTTPWLNLDGLLSHLVLFHGFQEEYFLLPKKKKLDFPEKWMAAPLKKTDEIYHASVSFFEPRSTVRVTNIYKRFETGGTDGLKTKKIRRGSGYFRDHILRQPYFAARQVYFYGCGDKELIDSLLNDYILGLGNDFRVGFGPVRGWKVEKVGQDFSLVRNGAAMRPIPVEMCAEFDEIVPMSYKPPHWDPRNIADCVPPGGRCVLR